MATLTAYRLESLRDSESTGISHEVQLQHDSDSVDPMHGHRFVMDGKFYKLDNLPSLRIAY